MLPAKPEALDTAKLEKATQIMAGIMAHEYLSPDVSQQKRAIVASGYLLVVCSAGGSREARKADYAYHLMQSGIDADVAHSLAGEAFTGASTRRVGSLDDFNDPAHQSSGIKVRRNRSGNRSAHFDPIKLVDDILAL